MQVLYQILKAYINKHFLTNDKATWLTVSNEILCLIGLLNVANYTLFYEECAKR